MNSLSYILISNENIALSLETVKSIINQRNHDFKFIVVTTPDIEDNIELLHEAMSDTNIEYQIIPSLGNSNKLEIMNEVIDGIESDYFMFLDAGDILPSYSTSHFRKFLGEYDMIVPSLFQKTFTIPQYVDYDKLKQTEDSSQLSNAKLLRQSSIVGVLFKTDLLNKCNIRLNTNIDIYAYCAMILEVASINSSILLFNGFPLYYKEDGYPTLDVLKFAENDFDDEFMDYVDRVIYSYEHAHTEEIKSFIRMDLISKLEIEFDPHHAQIAERHANNKEALNKAVAFIDTFLIDKKKPFFNLEMFSMKFKKDKLASQINDFRYRARLLKHVLTNHRTKNRSWYELKNRYTKVDPETILFESFAGQAYSDSPKAVYEYMMKTYPEYNYKWILRRPGSTRVPGHAEKIKRFSKQSYEAYSKAGFWVTNARTPLHLEKKNDQLYIQTWHGTPLKRLGNDMDNVKMPGTNTQRYKRNFRNETKRWDILISPNRYSTEIFKSAFWMKEENILEIGYPRNDVLVNRANDKEYISQIREKLNLPKDKKVILYAPTWRDDEYIKKGQYNFELKINLEKMYEELGDEYVILLRMHYLISNVLDIKGFEDFAIDVSSYNNISELYLISDCLITDYSSVMFDYGILKRPQFFYAYDLEKYEGELRGFYLDYMNDLPGPIVKTSDDLIEQLSNMSKVEKDYTEPINHFYDRFCSVDHGIASKIIGDMIHKQIQNSKK
ncbi:glycerophosphate transferase [Phocicoccus schoeneichii]|uniref:CDP-glycerol:poly(Glycerophosphate) glycerophosphotransferase n=2 Tax=Phocicoccus schoeneichii TaxID=1812261 RepID=A0A6V7RCS1_9BACL|nr:glycerophosphate transferase [Jeotgalicoccus schoeneichii]CAD2075541.1 CDP-glycerol:poly(glycerophosphate) glycerophosphotransferase [Jeotgalicoccus schoeneichii]